MEILLTLLIIINLLLIIVVYFILKKDEVNENSILYYNENLIRLLNIINSYELKNNLINRVKNKKLIIYGCGIAGKILYEILKNDCEILCFMETYKREDLFHGTKVLSFGEELNGENEYFFIMGILHKAEISIIEKLKKTYHKEILTLSQIN